MRVLSSSSLTVTRVLLQPAFIPGEYSRVVVWWSVEYTHNRHLCQESTQKEHLEELFAVLESTPGINAHRESTLATVKLSNQENLKWPTMG